MRLTTIKNLKRQKNGFTIIEVLVALALVAIFVYMVSNYSTIVNKRAQINRSNNTKNRVLSGIRDLAGMPASLRVSMRASANGAAVNPKLLACAGGNPVNSCKTGEEVPFTLYSPLIDRTDTGAIKGVSAISAPLNSTNPKRIDTFGFPCKEGSPASATCPLLVYTSFKAQCGPAEVASPTATTNMAPLAQCTVADVIEVTYLVRLDPSIETSDPGLASFVTPISGSVVVPVVAISGNVPQ